jgi:hypothetical protein
VQIQFNVGNYGSYRKPRGCEFLPFSVVGDGGEGGLTPCLRAAVLPFQAAQYTPHACAVSLQSRACTCSRSEWVARPTPHLLTHFCAAAPIHLLSRCSGSHGIMSCESPSDPLRHDAPSRRVAKRERAREGRGRLCVGPCHLGSW